MSIASMDSIHDPAARRRFGNSRLLIIAVLVCLVGAAVLLMTQEQDARGAAERASLVLGEMLDSGKPAMPDAVHKKIGREPDVTRTPARHRYVEEYSWKGPLNSYTVYAYYETAATQLLEAVSLNQRLDEWEQAPR